MQDRRCVSSANTAGVLPRLGFSQDLPEKSHSAVAAVKEQHVCTKALQHLLPVERKGKVSMFRMYREGKTAAIGWGGQGEGKRRIGRKSGDRQREGWPKKEGRIQSII